MIIDVKSISLCLISIILISCGGGEEVESSAISYKTDVQSQLREPVEDESVFVEDEQSLEEDSTTCVDHYYADKVEVLFEECKACHSSLGLAGSTAFVLGDETKLNQDFILSYMLENPNKIIEKNSGVLQHQGGALFDAEAIETLNTFKTYSTNLPLCQEDSTPVLSSTLSRSNIILMDYTQTLNKVTNVFYNRDAYENEKQSVKSKGELAAYLDSIMQDERFYTWLMYKFNDIFQIDQYLSNAGTGNAYIPTPSYKWYYGYKNIDEKKWWTIQKGVNYGHVRQSLELIAHVVRQERNFNEILTADYLLVNPFTAVSWDLNNSDVYPDNTLSGFIFDDSKSYNEYAQNEFKEVKPKVYGTYKKHSPNIDEYPLAGILTDQMFLWKYRTTATSRNRNRANFIAKVFLDLDIETLSLRSGGDTDPENKFSNPTTQNPDCTVCHYVLDPIAGNFHNFFAQYGSLFYRPRVGGWFDINEEDMFPVGYSMMEPLPIENRDNSLQWLAKKMVNDERFPRAMLKHFYNFLTAKQLLNKPKKEMENYEQKLQAYLLQEAIVDDILLKFENSGRNAKVLIKELIYSELFRSVGFDVETNSIDLDAFVDDARMLTPEQVKAKLDDKMPTTRPEFDGVVRSEWKFIPKTYNLLYGGIDNGYDNRRDFDMNAIKAGIQKRIAFNAGCKSLAFDIFFPKGELSNKVYTPYVERNTIPNSPENILKIKKNIQYLYKHLHNEDIGIDSEEMLSAYALLVQTYEDFKAEGSTRMIPVCSAGQSVNGVYQRNDIDDSYMVRTWSVMVNFLVDDYYFFTNVNKRGN